MWKTKLLLASLAILCASCETTGRVEIRTETRIVDTSCQWVKPILIDRDADMLTDGTADQIRAHNETGTLHGCWSPRKK